MTASLIVFDRAGSTSTLLLAWAKAASGLAEGTTVVARAQTAARGSHGRSWVSPAGNFAASILLRPGGAARDAGRLALLAAVALTDILPPIPGLRVKWPNDVMVDAAKLAGILVDAIADGPHLRAAIVGVGVNLAHAPAVPGRATCALAQFGVPAPDPVVMAAALRDALRARAEADFAAVAAAWLARADPPGTPLAVTTPGRLRRGRFAGLSPDGHLLLAEPGGIAVIAAGEVYP